MSEKELTYVFDEKPEEDNRIVGYMSIPYSLRDIACGFLPITAKQEAEIERRVAEVESERDAAQVRVELLGKLCVEMINALRDGRLG